MDWDAAIRPELAPLRPYAPGLSAEDVRERTGCARVLKLSSNEHPEGPVSAAVEAIRDVAGRVNRYPDGAARALRAALSERLGVPMPEVVVGSGSNEILRLIAQAVLRPGDEVVYAWPSFIVYPMVTDLFSGVKAPVPLRDDTHDLQAMLDAVTERTRLLFLCNPNNPTGTIFGRGELRRFLEAVPGHVLVVVDEAYREYVTAEDYPDAMEHYDGERPLCVARTFSKIYSLAGLRVGYAACPEPLAEAVAKAREPFNVNSAAQVAALASLGAEDEVSRRRGVNARQRESLERTLEDVGLAYAPSQANFVYTHTDRPQEFFEALLARGVIVRDFGDAPALRIGIPAEEDQDLLEEAIREAVAGLGASPSDEG